MHHSTTVYSPRQVAAFCGVSFRTVLRWIERGELRSYQLPGRGDHRIPAEDLLQFLTKNQFPLPVELAALGSRVLIVEPSAATAESMKFCLEQSGYECAVARTAFQAGYLLGTFRPCVVVVNRDPPQAPVDDLLDALSDSSTCGHVRPLVVTFAEGPPLDAGGRKLTFAKLDTPFSCDQLANLVTSLAPRVLRWSTPGSSA